MNTDTPETTDTSIAVVIKHGQKITFVNSNTGTESIHVTTSDTITLSKGFIYNIEIENKNLNLKDFYIVKENPVMAVKFLIRDVSDGTVTIYPLINGVSLKDADVVGKLI